ncbi:hypothetical protein B0H10DRAFT_1894722 [Mycena sp. CBHHK59/15]|nr:hypothetical protein B0H10DRAFT_1894722 [Mycena sp. CBHHK59/15]
METGTARRIDTLWYEDGNIVFQAGDSLFRLSRGVLARQSNVFQDMLAFPQPGDETLIDGCPVVQLQDDPKDVEDFFSAIFDSAFFEPPPSHCAFSTVAGILRLATKYDIAYLRRRALQHLNLIYPSTTFSWNLRRISGTIPSADLDDIENLTTIIALSQQVDTPWLIPAAMYFLSTRPMEVLVAANLSAALLAQCIILHGQLRQLEIMSIVCTFGDPVDVLKCTTAEQCRRTRLRCMALIMSEEQVHPLDPISRRIAGVDPMIRSLCAPCTAELEGDRRRNIDEVWDKLPQLLNLGRWEDVRTHEAERYTNADQ